MRNVTVTDEVRDYAASLGSWPPGEVVKRLRATTQALGDVAGMQIADDQGQFLTMTARLIGARRAVEVGTFTGYSSLCIARGLSPSVTATGVFHAVATHVNDLGKDRIHPVFLLDEAHLLHQDTLDHLHILLNYEWDSRALLSLVMVGLPELLDRLSMRRNRSLFSRLHRRLRIDPLSPVDTGEYIGMRLHRAGCERELFASDAIAMIHEAAMGGMRDADRLATAALREAARMKRKLVERDAVARTIDAHTNGDTGA